MASVLAERTPSEDELSGSDPRSDVSRATDCPRAGDAAEGEEKLASDPALNGVEHRLASGTAAVRKPPAEADGTGCGHATKPASAP